YFTALFCFDRLVQSVAPAASWHDAPGELVYDDHLALFHYVLLVEMVEGMSLERLLDAVKHLDVVGVVKIAHRQYSLGRLDAFLGQRSGMLFLVDVVDEARVLLKVDVAIGGFDIGDPLLLFGLQPDHAFICGVILLSGLFGRSGDNQGGTRFIDQYRIDFVDDRVEMPPLYEGRRIELHVVAEIVKTELVIRAVDDVAIIGLLALEVVHIMLNAADCQSEKPVDLTHPFSIALCQVVVDSDNMDALAGEGIQVGGESRHERLAFSRFHSRNHSAMPHPSPDY